MPSMVTFESWHLESVLKQRGVAGPVTTEICIEGGLGPGSIQPRHINNFSPFIALRRKSNKDMKTCSMVLKMLMANHFSLLNGLKNANGKSLLTTKRV